MTMRVRFAVAPVLVGLDQALPAWVSAVAHPFGG